MTREEYRKLVDTAHKAQTLYEAAQPTGMTDDEYDFIVQWIRATESAHPDWIEDVSPTQVISVKPEINGFKDVTHRNAMLSIRDVFSFDEVASWVRNVKLVLPDAVFSVEEKIDGTSLTLRYVNGKLMMGESRGNGFVGSDITVNAKEILDVPESLPYPAGYLEVRGEAYIPKDGFNAYCKMCEEKGEKIPANARNLAAGTLRSYTPTDVKERGVRFFAFNIQESTLSDTRESHRKGMAVLDELGFHTVTRKSCADYEEVKTAIEEIGKRRDSLPYGIDGAVIKLDDISSRELFPSGGSKYAPGRIAFKYQAESRNVELDSVELDIGKTGKVSYVGLIHDSETGGPAFLAGTKVSRVTLNNMGFIRDMHIGIGGQYTLIKSGDIIPKLVGLVREPDAVFEEPDVCPHCGTKLTHAGTVDLFCTNPDCVAARIRNIMSFGERDRMDIKGLGESTVTALVNSGYVQDVSDLYVLGDKRKAIIGEGILGEGTFDNLLNAIDRSKNVPASRVLAAINIPGVGRHMSADLIAEFGSIDKIGTASMGELLSVPGVGITAVSSIIDFFGEEKNRNMLERLRNAGLQFSEEKKDVQPASGPLSGETVVITGKFVISGKSRTEVQAEVEKLGGKVGSSIGKTTTLLLVGEKAGSKLKKAQDKGIRIMLESEFLTLL